MFESGQPAGEQPAAGAPTLPATRQLCGIREAARRLADRGIKLHASTISRQIGTAIANYGTDARPLVDVDEIARTRELHLDPAKQRRPESPAPDADDDEDAGDAATGGPLTARGALSEARRRKTEAEAALAELDLAKKRGEVLDRAEVESVFFEVATMIREQLTQRAALLAAELAGLSDITAVNARINAADQAALTKASDELNRRIASLAATASE